MKWLYQLERKYGRYAIPNLMLYVTATMLAVYMFDTMMSIRGISISGYLYLSRSLLLRGQIWRLVTFLAVPISNRLFSVLISLLFYYSIGATLESQWGTFYFNAYFVVGALGAIAAGLITGVGTNFYVYSSLFLAYAQLFPDNEFMLFFLVPVKARYIGYATWILYALGLAGSLLAANWSGCLALVMSLINFFIFFGPTFWSDLRGRMHSRNRRREFQKQMKDNRDLWR